MTPPLCRKWRGTKKPLDESEGGERKSQLKAQHSENEDHGIWSHHFVGNRWGNSGNSVRLLFWAPKSLQMVIVAMKLKDTPWKESYDQPRQYIPKQRHYFANKGPSSQGCGFSSGHVWVWELDCEESWTVKTAERRRIDAFELWCWRRLLRVPWTARRSTQSIKRRSVLGVHWKDWC